MDAPEPQTAEERIEQAYAQGVEATITAIWLVVMVLAYIAAALFLNWQ